MKNSVKLISEFPVSVKTVSMWSRYVTFNYTPGKRYRIVYANGKGNLHTEGSGIALTYTRNNLKYGVLQRRLYGNLNEALYTAALWESLVQESNNPNRWGYWFNKFYVLDTKTGELINCNVLL